MDPMPARSCLGGWVKMAERDCLRAAVNAGRSPGTIVMVLANGLVGKEVKICQKCHHRLERAGRIVWDKDQRRPEPW